MVCHALMYVPIDIGYVEQFAQSPNMFSIARIHFRMILMNASYRTFYINVSNSY